MNKSILGSILPVLFLVSVLPAHAVDGPLQICEAGLLNGSGGSAHAVQIFESIFGNHATAVHLAAEVESVRQKTIASRPRELLAEDLKRVQDPNWLQDEVQYMGYVNFMGTEKGKGTFRTLDNMLPYLSGTVGASMIYPLPYLKSPFKDAGFDVADFRTVDDRFGGNAEFKPFRQALTKTNGKLQMDLILNHISEEHPWAKKAVAGDPKFRKYFHILETPPRVVSVTKDKDGLPVAARYLETDEHGVSHEVERRVIFPQFANPEHPHYVRMTDGHGKTIWVYHTFYPFQWDLNYSNPETLREAFEIVGYWANQGVDVIRLDAIPFLFKDQESDPRTMKVVESLRYFLAQSTPSTVIIVEACQEPKVVYKFFGKVESYNVAHLAHDFKTTSTGQLAYNFDLMNYTWASLLAKDKSFFLDIVRDTKEPPPGAVWANFLRLHDELTLEMAPESVRSVIRRELLNTGKGTPFRGDLGVGGRMGDFLDRDPRRMKLAFSLLLSLKGLPIIYYGDEIMARGDHAYAARAAADRGGQFDARDEGRGPIELADYQSAVAAGNSSPEGTVLNSVRTLVQMRKQRASLRRGDTTLINTNHQAVIAYTRAIPGEKTLMLHNLSGSNSTVTVGIKLAASTRLTDLLTRQGLAFTAIGDQIQVTLMPYQTVWLAI
jgi:maltose alpha-D-glucosyltransferase/alpha-amylase